MTFEVVINGNANIDNDKKRIIERMVSEASSPDNFKMRTSNLNQTVKLSNEAIQMFQD